MEITRAILESIERWSRSSRDARRPAILPSPSATSSHQKRSRPKSPHEPLRAARCLYARLVIRFSLCVKFCNPR